MDETLVHQRLEVLRQELKAGEGQLLALNERRDQLQQTMHRITGAIQVLEELLAHSKSP